MLAQHSEVSTTSAVARCSPFCRRAAVQAKYGEESRFFDLQARNVPYSCLAGQPRHFQPGHWIAGDSIHD
jgi:hypothetical protein